ncbi:hypothetical protein [Dysgonomonas sp. ZJ279]|uniref:hypothetical protein n=1 Tax=Dysgonomonas sp. ZJ279 TaxID=2709796 RepID=UPI0013ED3469|nr:hypothetical protein [Dysgonomonas sp. ZJ279]
MKYILHTILLISFISCAQKPIRNSYSIKQISSDYPVIIRADIYDNQVFRIQFPLVFEYTKSPLDKGRITSINYYYSKDHGKSYLDEISSNWLSRIWIYQIIDDKLVDKRLGASEEISQTEKFFPIEILGYTSHLVDTTKKTQDILRPYLEQIKARGVTQGKDTLSIGTFNEFKKMHPELTKILLEGDSISFNIFNNENQMDTLIVLPIRY